MSKIQQKNCHHLINYAPGAPFNDTENFHKFPGKHTEINFGFLSRWKFAFWKVLRRSDVVRVDKVKANDD